MIQYITVNNFIYTVTVFCSHFVFFAFSLMTDNARFFATAAQWSGHRPLHVLLRARLEQSDCRRWRRHHIFCHTPRQVLYSFTITSASKMYSSLCTCWSTACSIQLSSFNKYEYIQFCEWLSRLCSKQGINELFENQHFGPVTGVSAATAGASGVVGSLDLSQLFLSSSFDCSVKLWHMREKRPLLSFEGVRLLTVHTVLVHYTLSIQYDSCRVMLRSDDWTTNTY